MHESECVCVWLALVVYFFSFLEYIPNCSKLYYSKQWKKTGKHTRNVHTKRTDTHNKNKTKIVERKLTILLNYNNSLTREVKRTDLGQKRLFHWNFSERWTYFMHCTREIAVKIGIRFDMKVKWKFYSLAIIMCNVYVECTHHILSQSS